jgi:hypothetical protein
LVIKPKGCAKHGPIELVFRLLLPSGTISCHRRTEPQLITMRIHKRDWLRRPASTNTDRKAAPSELPVIVGLQNGVIYETAGKSAPKPSAPHHEN